MFLLSASSRNGLFCASFLAMLASIPAALATFYVRGPVEKGEYVATLVEQVSYPRFSKGMFGPYMYNSYENGANFYSGLVHKELAERSAFGTTFWQGSMEGPVEILHTGSYFFPLTSISEGASGSAGGNIPYMLEDTWYEIVYKIWQPGKGGNSLLGVWQQDVEKGIWRHVLTAQLPVVSNGFNGATGFIEPLNKEPQVHRMERRKSYGYFNGKGWRSMNELTVYGGKPNVNNLRFWKIINNDQEEKQEIFFAAKEKKRLPDFNVPHGEKPTFTFKQPEQPSFPALEIQLTKAEALGNQLHLAWQRSEQSAPTIDARLEFLDAGGQVLETFHSPRPYLTELNYTPQVNFTSIRLVATDIYGQEANISVERPTAQPLVIAAASIDPQTLASGVDFEYFGNQRQDFKQLADIEGREVTNFGIAPRIDLSVHDGARRKAAYAAKFRGYLQAPTDGFYQIHLRASDGFRLKLGETELVRDGERGLTAEVLTLALKQGFHPIEVDYFHSRSSEGYLLLDWLKPGQSEVIPIGPEAFFHNKQGKPAPPQVQLAIDGSNSPVIKVSLQGQIPDDLKEVRYFASKDLWRRTETAPFIIEGGAVSGNQQYYAKLYFQDGRVWTSPSIEFLAENFLNGESEWRYESRSENTAPVSYSFETSRLSITGRGTHEFRRKVEGDFTFKARIDKLEGGDDRSFIALGKAKDRFAIFASTRQGISIPSHQRNHGGGGFSGKAVVEGEESHAPWICLANKGGRFTTYYSYDGEIWNKANEAFFDGDLGEVTILFETKLAEGEPFLKVALSEMSWQDSFDPALEPQTRRVELDLDENSILGLVSGGGDIAYARTKQGLLRSDDFGKTWQAYLGNSVEKADGIIRSIAVSPHDPQLMFVAEIEQGGSKLLKSVNGGQSWQRVESPVSFASDHFSLLCGELIDFHPEDKNRLAIGGQEGLFLSDNQGQSWKLHGLKDLPLSFVRWHVAAIKMGRGHQLFAASSQENKLHAWNFEGRSLYREIPISAPVMDVRFQPADYMSWFYVLTTRGVFETVNAGKKFMQMHSPEALSLKQQEPGKIYDQAITALALARHSKPSTTQRIMVAFTMLNADKKKPQVTYLKGSYNASLLLNEGELPLKALDHPTKSDQGIIGTNQGLYFTAGNRGLHRGKFEPSQVQR